MLLWSRFARVLSGSGWDRRQSFLGGCTIKLVQLSFVEAEIISHGVGSAVPIIGKRRRVWCCLSMWKFSITVSIRTKKLAAIAFLWDCDASIVELGMVEGINDSYFGSNVTVCLRSFIVGVLLAILRTVPTFSVARQHLYVFVRLRTVIISTIESLFGQYRKVLPDSFILKQLNLTTFAMILQRRWTLVQVPRNGFTIIKEITYVVSNYSVTFGDTWCVSDGLLTFYRLGTCCPHHWWFTFGAESFLGELIIQLIIHSFVNRIRCISTVWEVFNVFLYLCTWLFGWCSLILRTSPILITGDHLTERWRHSLVGPIADWSVV